MRLPRLKDLKSKLGAARLLGVVVKNSLAFKIRKGARSLRRADFETIIVDMDGTLYKTDANLEALMAAYPELTENGEPAGREIYEKIISKIASGEYSIERAVIEGNKFLMARKMDRQHFFQVLDHIKPQLRRQLIQALADIQQSGKKVVLATLSSKDFAKLLNEHLKRKYSFEFDAITGTELSFDSSNAIIGIKSMLGTKNSEYEGIKVRSKLTAVKDALNEKGVSFDPKKAVLITDSYGDIDIAKMIVTILIKPSTSTAAQRVSQRLGLADYILPDNRDLKLNIESIILGAEKDGENPQKENGASN